MEVLPNSRGDQYSSFWWNLETQQKLRSLLYHEMEMAREPQSFICNLTALWTTVWYYKDGKGPQATWKSPRQTSVWFRSDWKRIRSGKALHSGTRKNTSATLKTKWWQAVLWIPAYVNAIVQGKGILLNALG